MMVRGVWRPFAPSIEKTNFFCQEVWSPVSTCLTKVNTPASLPEFGHAQQGIVLAIQRYV